MESVSDPAQNHGYSCLGSCDNRLDDNSLVVALNAEQYQRSMCQRQCVEITDVSSGRVGRFVVAVGTSLAVFESWSSLTFCYRTVVSVADSVASTSPQRPFGQWDGRRRTPVLSLFGGYRFARLRYLLHTILTLLCSSYPVGGSYLADAEISSGRLFLSLIALLRNLFWIIFALSRSESWKPHATIRFWIMGIRSHCSRSS
jgi:hypothetical protein